MNFFKKLFGSRPEQKSSPVPLPERPADWNLTVEDLMAEARAGKRKSIGQPELGWAKEYERSLIPPDCRFPRMGDLYESKADLTVEYITAWAAPFSGGGKGTLYKGERVWIHTKDTEERPVVVYAEPVDYKVVEERMVPLAERNNPKYGGMYFYLDTVGLNTNFILIGKHER